jgi:hypothetical protein
MSKLLDQYVGHVRFLRVLTLGDGGARKAALVGMKAIHAAFRKRDADAAAHRHAQAPGSSEAVILVDWPSMTYKAEIPYGAYWSTPFARWQGSFANLHSIEFAAHVARRELAQAQDRPVAAFDYGALGFSVPQKHSFYGLPWLMGLIGAGRSAARR